MGKIKNLTPEQIAKRTAARKKNGWWRTPAETAAKQSVAMRGRATSIQKGDARPPEVCAKISASLIKYHTNKEPKTPKPPQPPKMTAATVLPRTIAFKEPDEWGDKFQYWEDWE